MYIIYNLLMIGAFFLVMPYFIYRSICEKGFTKRLRQSLGGRLYQTSAPEPWRYSR